MENGNAERNRTKFQLYIYDYLESGIDEACECRSGFRSGFDYFPATLVIIRKWFLESGSGGMLEV